MNSVLQNLPQKLIDESGMPGIGVSIERDRETGGLYQTTVGEFLSRPENMSGTWYIDGGWGGPPGPIRVDWDGERWINMGFPPWE